MPRKKKETVVEAPVAVMELEVVIEEEVRPRGHLIFLTKQFYMAEFDTTGYKKVGTITYWESTNDLTYTYEVGFQIFMDSFVLRDIDVKSGKSVLRQNTREWFENLPNALLHDSVFCL